MQASYTEVGDFDLISNGYNTVIPLSDTLKLSIQSMQAAICESIPASKLWLPTGDQLHITLAHIISPEVTYTMPSDALFNAVYGSRQRQALKRIADTLKNQQLVFDRVGMSTGAIILKTSDDGLLDKARANFTDNISPPKGTRIPPNIVHVTIARFRERFCVADVEAAIATLKPHFSMNIEHIRLIHEKKLYVQSYDLVEEF